MSRRILDCEDCKTSGFIRTCTFVEKERVDPTTGVVESYLHPLKVGWCIAGGQAICPEHLETRGVTPITTPRRKAK